MKLFSIIKKSKIYYYTSNGVLDLIPKYFFERRLNSWLDLAKNYPKKTIDDRVSYYCSFQDNTNISDSFIKIRNYKRPKKHSIHYYDLKKVIRYYNNRFKIAYKFGDITENQDQPTFVKSRPIAHNGNSVLLKLNELRHFNFIIDKKKFKDKKNKIVWRGVIHKENRKSLFEKHFKNSNFDLGSSREKNSKPAWRKPFLTIEEQLDFKFILSIEGVDVATNLKWIMSSNSLAFMPKPKFETWYMEGKLIPNIHYVLIKDDYSDVEEKMEFYLKNIEEAEKIITNAKKWTDQFKDKKLEKILSILTVNRYFKKTNQL